MTIDERTTDGPKTCPKCSSKSVVPIVYGLPGPELMVDVLPGMGWSIEAKPENHKP